jgi:hypothetical protein
MQNWRENVLPNHWLGRSLREDVNDNGGIVVNFAAPKTVIV